MKNNYLKNDCRKIEQINKKNYVVEKELCQICGRTKLQTQLHHHHEDYSKPFNVITLCRSCHQKYHQKWHDFVIFEGLPLAKVFNKQQFLTK